MTATIRPPEAVEALKPDYVAPLVVFLGHNSNTEESGSVFEVGSGWIAKSQWQRTSGVGFPVDCELTPEEIAHDWTRITDFNDGRAVYPTSTQESIQPIMDNFNNHTSHMKIDVAAIQKKDFGTLEYTYGEHEVILYALGVGCKRATYLNFIYENDASSSVLPTFGVIPSFAEDMSVDLNFLPNFNPMMLLHGEQFLSLKKPISTANDTVFKLKARIIDSLDKGKGASVIIGVTTTDEIGGSRL